MYDPIEIYESLVNGQRKQATRQLRESDYSLNEVVSRLQDSGFSDSQILNEIKKLEV